jgi:hypothetical protein
MQTTSSLFSTSPSVSLLLDNQDESNTGKCPVEINSVGKSKGFSCVIHVNSMSNSWNEKLSPQGRSVKSLVNLW